MGNVTEACLTKLWYHFLSTGVQISCPSVGLSPSASPHPSTGGKFQDASPGSFRTPPANCAEAELQVFGYSVRRKACLT